MNDMTLPPAGPARPHGSRSDGSQSGSPQLDWLDIGTLADIPPQGARVVRGPDGDIAVFRTADDQVFALTDRCPHAGGPLSQGIVHGHRVACPLHSWLIDLATGEAVAPDQGCAGRHPLRRHHDRLLLGLRPAPDGCRHG